MYLNTSLEIQLLSKKSEISKKYAQLENEKSQKTEKLQIYKEQTLKQYLVE